MDATKISAQLTFTANQIRVPATIFVNIALCIWEILHATEIKVDKRKHFTGAQ